MKRGFIFVVVIASLPATVLAAANSTHRTAAKPQTVTVPAQVAPAPPATLEQSAAVPARVTFQNGQLSIIARNSTLGDILKSVQKLTGAEIELPGNASERVVGTFGPGPARDVLSDLLYGSHYNYVVLGSESDPQAVAKIMLIAKSAGSGADSSPTETASAYQGNNVSPAPMGRPFPGRPGMPVPTAAPQQATDDSDAQSDDDTADDQTDDQTDNTDDQNGDNTATVQGEEPADANQQVKSPEQMLQEMQQQQQQQQQNPNQPIMRPGFPPGMPGMPPGAYPPGQNPGGSQQQ
ncbi:MAG TPA: hypothetical protein VF753_10565 [Terriglobales bacterium]